MNEQEAQLRKKISRTKLMLMSKRKTTFFSALLSGMKLILTEEIATACTNGTYIKFNPNFIEPLSNEKLMGLMLHELGHTIFQHVSRRMEHKLDTKIHNIAGDHYINLWLTKLGFEIPDNGYCDPKYAGWSTMQIYKDLMNNPPLNAKDFVEDIEGKPLEMEPGVFKEILTSNILKAINQAKIANDFGSIPGELLREFDELLNPTLPWQVVLAPYMSNYVKEQYTWSRPNRRYLPYWYLPSQHSEALKLITVGCDVSGSMDKEDLTAIFTEVRYIWYTLKPESMRIQTFDTRVHMDKLFKWGESLDKLVLKGGGGTEIGPLLQRIREENPRFALIFTDGFFSVPDTSGIYSDIFWIIKGNKKFQNPIGTIIHM